MIRAQLAILICLPVFSYLYLPVTCAQTSSDASKAIVKFPENNSKNVNPDVQLRLTFPDEPILGNSGKICVYDAENDELVDSLDMSIPPGPRNSRTPASYKKIKYETEEDFIKANTDENGRKIIPVPLKDIYQKKYIGGNLESDLYHFYPVLINNNEATICFRNNHLGYNKTYYVQIDQGVLSFSDSSLFEITGKSGWTFSTKKTPPSLDKDTYVVSQDGAGDFNTVQGAIDHIPENNYSRKTIYIKNGRYEEIVYFRNRNNLTFLGEDREKTIICYANNGFFNPRPSGPREEMIRRFRNRRSVFAVHHSNGIHLLNFTIKSLGEKPAQAEGLLIRGEENIIYNISIIGSGDALQATGKIYMEASSILGFGDNVLGYGAVFFKDCELVSTYGPHLWVRNTNENHGNVFVNCTFSTIGDVETTIARAPSSINYSFPYVEAVLINCAMEGIRPEGWGKVGEETGNIHYWEYNSVNLKDGKPVDVNHRVPYSRQLTMENDSLIIASYSNPEYVLDGWNPKLAPLILSQPGIQTAEKGKAVEFSVKVAAIPEARYQWYRDDVAINGATGPDLRIESVSEADTGLYSVTVSNIAGGVTSRKATLEVMR